jgi:hypothetical protein
MQLFLTFPTTMNVVQLCCRYEESCRQLLGNNAFVLYTLDKVIMQALKCLQAMANDENIQKLVGLFVYHRSLGLASGTGEDPELYLNHVSQTLSHTMEDVYRFQLMVPLNSGSTTIQMACQFLGKLTACVCSVYRRLTNVYRCCRHVWSQGCIERSCYGAST